MLEFFWRENAKNGSAFKMPLFGLDFVEDFSLDGMRSPKNMFEINHSQLIQYEILEKLVTYIGYRIKLNLNNK